MLLEIFRERQWLTETDIINKVKPPGSSITCRPGVLEDSAMNTISTLVIAVFSRSGKRADLSCSGTRRGPRQRAVGGVPRQPPNRSETPTAYVNCSRV
jgi:hypothetical protein